MLDPSPQDSIVASPHLAPAPGFPPSFLGSLLLGTGQNVNLFVVLKPPKHQKHHGFATSNQSTYEKQKLKVFFSPKIYLKDSLGQNLWIVSWMKSFVEV